MILRCILDDFCNDHYKWSHFLCEARGRTPPFSRLITNIRRQNEQIRRAPTNAFGVAEQSSPQNGKKSDFTGQTFLNRAAGASLRTRAMRRAREDARGSRQRRCLARRRPASAPRAGDPVDSW